MGQLEKTMTKTYMEKGFDRIVCDKELIFPKNTALAATWILAAFKGINLKIFDMRESSSLADYYVLGSAQNVTTARSMAEGLESHLKRHRYSARSIEGLESAQWILLDFGDMIIHIFQESVRDIFDLDELWKEYPSVPIPQEYYFSRPEGSEEEEAHKVEEGETTEPYF
ncbi:MAG: ribosome silencing factor [Bacteriovoracales bacterium]|nr:ribosome silencing factor [Bacteriovoracales bacterium]